MPAAPLTVDELRADVADGSIDTVVLAIVDMQGRLQGKRLRRGVLPRRGARARHRGLQLPARRRRRDEHRRRLRDLVVGARLRRPGHGAGLRHAAADAVAAGHRAAAGRRAVARRHAGRRVAAPDPAAPARPARRARLEGVWSAPSSSSSSSTTATSRPGPSAITTWRRPTSTTSTTRSSAPAGSSRCCGRSGSACATPGMQVESAKGECNLGQHEIAFKYADALTTCDNHVDLQERRQGDRGAARLGADLHGEVQRARGQLLPHPPVAARRRRRAGLRRRPRARRLAGVRALPRRAARRAARAELLLRAEHQLLQAIPGRIVRADRRDVGHRQPHLLAARGRPRARACGSRTGCRAATSTPTSRWPR